MTIRVGQHGLGRFHLVAQSLERLAEGECVSAFSTFSGGGIGALSVHDSYSFVLVGVTPINLLPHSTPWEGGKESLWHPLPSVFTTGMMTLLSLVGEVGLIFGAVLDAFFWNFSSSDL